MNERYELVTGGDGKPAVQITRAETMNLRQARNALILLQKAIAASEVRLADMRLQYEALGETVDLAAAESPSKP